MYRNPCVDGNFTSQPYLKEAPEILLEKGFFNHEIEVIIGSNAEEGIFAMFDLIKDPSKWEYFRNNFDTLGPMKLFGIKVPHKITLEDVQKAHQVVKFYVGSVENLNQEHLDQIIEMFTDAYFQYSTYKMVQFLTKWNITTYQYLLTFRGQFSYSQLYGIEPMGVCHADDLIYLFDPVFGKGELKLNRTEVALREVMTSAWTNFAKFGDPTPPGKNCEKV